MVCGVSDVLYVRIYVCGVSVYGVSDVYFVCASVVCVVHEFVYSVSVCDVCDVCVVCAYVSVYVFVYGVSVCGL